jgi:hypothetical protein
MKFIATTIARVSIYPIMTIFISIQKIKSIVPALAVLPRLAIKASVDRLRMVGTLLKIISIAICAS